MRGATTAGLPNRHGTPHLQRPLLLQALVVALDQAVLVGGAGSRRHSGAVGLLVARAARASAARVVTILN